MGEKKDNDGYDPILLGIGFALVVIALWVATPFVVSLLYVDSDKRGQFGDLFGSINALFSGLAFVGVIVAILLQKQELALQRQELKETRAEMTRTADAQEAAQQALNKTIWAQSYKVARDLLDEPRVISARKTIINNRERLRSGRTLWGSTFDESVDIVGRSYDAVGTMVRKGLMPENYILDVFGVEIGRMWFLLRPHVEDIRLEADDPGKWKDFENLALSADTYLRENDIRA